MNRAIQWGVKSKAVRVIQPNVRRWLAVFLVERIRRERDTRCAWLIQLAYRTRMAKRRLAWLLAQRERLQRVDASTQIQQRVRSRAALKKVQIFVACCMDASYRFT